MAPRASIALLAAAVGLGSSAQESSAIDIFGVREDRTAVVVGPKLAGRPTPIYGATLHAEVVRQIRRTYLPFRTAAPAAVVVRLTVDRQGKLVRLSLLKKSGAKAIDDYALAMVVEAARRFPPAPADVADDVFDFAIPIKFAGPPPDEDR